MKLIPYCIYKHIEQSENPVYKIILFLENGGKAPIQIDSEESAKQYLSENGIFLKSEIWSDEDCMYAPVDSEKTIFSDFYTWIELDYLDKRECWRVFYKIPSLVFNSGNLFDKNLEVVLRRAVY